MGMAYCSEVGEGSMEGQVIDDCPPLPLVALRKDKTQSSLVWSVDRQSEHERYSSRLEPILIAAIFLHHSTPSKSTVQLKQILYPLRDKGHILAVAGF